MWLLRMALKGTILAKSAQNKCACSFDRLRFGYVPSSIYDSIRAIKHVSVVPLCHYQLFIIYILSVVVYSANLVLVTPMVCKLH